MRSIGSYVGFFGAVAAVAVVASCLVAVPAALAGDPRVNDTSLVNVDANGVILDEYDTVALYTDGKPVKGDPKFRSRYEDAIYDFASAEHKALFDVKPEQDKPRFGARCAYAVSLGRTAPIDVAKVN